MASVSVSSFRLDVCGEGVALYRKRRALLMNGYQPDPSFAGSPRHDERGSVDRVCLTGLSIDR